MQHEYDDGSIAQISHLRHHSHQGLFFLIIEMARRGNFLSYQLDCLCWIMFGLAYGEEPGKIPLETDKVS
jgi:hypothetical protein